MNELQEIIEAEIKEELIDIRYKMKDGVPSQFIVPGQTKVHVLQWVLEEIEKIKTKFPNVDQTVETHKTK